MTGGPIVRTATADDVDAVAHLLADAFDDYVWTNWAVPAEDHHARLRTLYEIHSSIGAHRGDLWVLEVRGAIVSAAAWSLLDGSIPPSEAGYRGVPSHLVQRAANELPPLFGDRLEAVKRAEAATLPSRPKEPYWFLDCVGTSPDHQRCGYALQLLTAALERLDADRLPTVLETSTATNVALYEQLGFVQTIPLRLGPEVPPVWVMTRPLRQR